MLLPGQNCKVLKIIKILIVVAINVVFYINFNHFCLIYPIRLFVSSQTSDSLSSITFETNIYIVYTKLVNVESLRKTAIFFMLMTAIFVTIDCRGPSI